jgi:hypothetical protein
MPRASFGKTTTATATIAHGEECSAASAEVQCATWPSSVTIRHSPRRTTTVVSPRYPVTRTTETRTASEKPRKKTTASRASRVRVTGMIHGSEELLSRWAAASEADREMVMRKSQAPKPRRTRTRSLPFQPVTIRASMPTDPSPSGDSRAIRR